MYTCCQHKATWPTSAPSQSPDPILMAVASAGMREERRQQQSVPDGTALLVRWNVLHVLYDGTSSSIEYTFYHLSHDTTAYAALVSAAST